MNKHAYLIIAHKDDLTFRTLLKLIDNEKHDIFIHMDKKNSSYDLNSIEAIMKHSKIYHVQRTDVKWGGYSQINSELLLLEKAVITDDYSFYHLLSGEDLLLKPSNQVYDFFEMNVDKNFVRFEEENFRYQNRVKYYHLFQDFIGRENNLFLKIVNKVSYIFQAIFKVNRNSDIIFQKGTNWFSINRDLAKYVIQKKDFIKETFKFTYCADEIFLQTIVHNSRFKRTLYHLNYDNNLTAIMRYIDWERGNPYIFREDDFEELIGSSYMFARKFNAQIDKDIIIKLSKNLLK